MVIDQQPATAKLGLSKIRQIHINAHDMARAVAFYRDQLGMKLIFQTPKMAFFECQGIRLMLGIPETKEFDHPSSIVYFWVDDIQKAHEELSGRGVRFEGTPHIVGKLGQTDVWMVHFRDSENNLHSLTSEAPAK